MRDKKSQIGFTRITKPKTMQELRMKRCQQMLASKAVVTAITLN
jgi:hypothetical protein